MTRPVSYPLGAWPLEMRADPTAPEQDLSFRIEEHNARVLRIWRTDGSNCRPFSPPHICTSHDQMGIPAVEGFNSTHNALTTQEN